MSRLTNTAAATLVAFLAAACGRSRTNEPVVTRTPEGKSISPSGTAAADSGKSMVRLVNAVPSQPAVSLTADDSTVFTGVQRKAVTPYKEVKDNIVTFRLRAGGDAVLADNRETMADGARYTIVALPSDDGSKAQMRVLRDEVVPDQGKARIRLINAAPRIEKVDLAVQGSRDPLFTGVGHGAEAGYKDIDPTTATLEIRNGQHMKPISIKNMKLEAGRAYTIVLVSDGASMSTITFDDTATGATLSQR